MSEYGIPYMGSKATIIPSIAMLFPKATHFYDLFGGGFSVSHYMVKNKANIYSHFHYNEIKKDIVEVVKKAINGDYNYDKFKPEWISKEDFVRLKEIDPYIKICWSFGNVQKAYMFGYDIEPYKKSMHMAVVFDEFDSLSSDVLGFSKWPSIAKTIKKKRLYLSQKIEYYRVNNILPKILHQFLSSEQLAYLHNRDKFRQLQRLKRLQQLERLEQLKRLQQLQQLERLEQLQRLQRLQRLPKLQQLSFYSKDYREVEILPSSVVYCDIPYQGTADYGNFSHKEFFDWAASRVFPIYISEYNISDKRFKLVYDIEKRSLMSPDKKHCKTKTEKLYWNGVTNI